MRKEGYTGLIRSDYQLKQEDARVWSKDELVDLFKVDINTFERGVLRLSPTLANHQSKFDAVVSFAYNAGLGNYQRSTIRMKVNRGDWDGAGVVLRHGVLPTVVSRGHIGGYSGCLKLRLLLPLL